MPGGVPDTSQLMFTALCGGHHHLQVLELLPEDQDSVVGAHVPVPPLQVWADQILSSPVFLSTWKMANKI